MCEFTHGSGKHIQKKNGIQYRFHVDRLGSPMYYSIGLPFSIYYKQRSERLETLWQ